MALEPTDERQAVIELVAIANLAGALALLLWRE